MWRNLLGLVLSGMAASGGIVYVLTTEDRFLVLIIVSLLLGFKLSLFEVKQDQRAIRKSTDKIVAWFNDMEAQHAQDEAEQKRRASRHAN